MARIDLDYRPDECNKEEKNISNKLTCAATAQPAQAMCQFSEVSIPNATKVVVAGLISSSFVQSSLEISCQKALAGALTYPAKGK